MEPEDLEKANARCEIFAKIILVSVTSAAIAGIGLLLTMVTMTTPFLKVTIGSGFPSLLSLNNIL